jgi:murein L,D-transpeptidase YafK
LVRAPRARGLHYGASIFLRIFKASKELELWVQAREMQDTDIEEIYTLADAALRNGQPSCAVHIFPFRMSQKHLRHVRHSRWLPFWLNLKEGYDHFARTRRPPLVLVVPGRNNPSLYTVNGRPLYVHLNGLAIV